MAERWIADTTLVRLLDADSLLEQWRGSLADFERTHKLTDMESAVVRAALRSDGLWSCAALPSAPAFVLEVLTSFVFSLAPEMAVATLADLRDRLAHTHTVVTDLRTGEVTWCSMPPATDERDLRRTYEYLQRMAKGRTPATAA